MRCLRVNPALAPAALAAALLARRPRRRPRLCHRPGGEVRGVINAPRGGHPVRPEACSCQRRRGSTALAAEAAPRWRAQSVWQGCQTETRSERGRQKTPFLANAAPVVPGGGRLWTVAQPLTPALPPVFAARRKFERSQRGGAEVGLARWLKTLAWPGYSFVGQRAGGLRSVEGASKGPLTNSALMTDKGVVSETHPPITIGVGAPTRDRPLVSRRRLTEISRAPPLLLPPRCVLHGLSASFGAPYTERESLSLHVRERERLRMF